MKIQVGSLVTIRYVKSDTTQYDKKILSVAEADVIRADKKGKFENVITEDSPLGLAIMGLQAGETGAMELPEHQGGIHQVEIIGVKN
jgi:transcription elongation GreA/GreB family factor